jgi:hypothetical protein
MALTSTTIFDIIGQTQTIVFSNPSAIDQIDFSNNQITYGSNGGFNLAKSDCLLYLQYLIIFQNLLFSNFPSLLSSVNLALPVSLFTLSNINVGVTHINYLQTSGANSIYSINYVPLAQAAYFTSRSSSTTTLQEFFTSILLLNQYKNQVMLN